MQREERITTRQLLREFKKYKDALLSGKIHVIYIRIGDDEELQMTAQRRGLTGREFVDRIRAYAKPMHIERSNLFDDLLRPRED